MAIAANTGTLINPPGSGTFCAGSTLLRNITGCGTNCTADFNARCERSPYEADFWIPITITRGANPDGQPYIYRNGPSVSVSWLQAATPGASTTCADIRYRQGSAGGTHSAEETSTAFDVDLIQRGAGTAPRPGGTGRRSTARTSGATPSRS